MLAALLSDQLIPLLKGSKWISFGWGRDRGSFLLFYLALMAGFAAGLYLRLRNIGEIPFWVRVGALVLLIAGTALREWAILTLGRFFSRTVRIEQGHRLVTSGPFRWIRHPAYTGMLIMYASILLALGTWVGAVLIFVLLLLATLYRIKVEEQVLVETFGDEYRAYRQRTASLFPPW